jgi:hypothetical protein
MAARKRRKPRKQGATGGSTRNPNSLANLRNRVAPGATIAVKHGAYARIASDRLDAKAREVYDGRPATWRRWWPDARRGNGAPTRRRALPS